MNHLDKSPNILNKALSFIRNFKNANSGYKPSLRVIKIEKESTDNYTVKIQLINKSSISTMKPEEILADDNLTNQFSPLDVRTLTYLGYLGINSPQYKILAKQLSDKNDQTLFALHKKGENKKIIKTANEISSEDDILTQLNPKDAHMIGLTTAMEQQIMENYQKKSLLDAIDDNLTTLNNQ